MTLFDTTEFFGRRLPTPASSRNAIGKVMEEFVARAFNVELLPVDGRKNICPDFANGEIKSVGRNNRVLIYKWRLEKELQNFAAKEYFYIFGRHTCPITVADVSQIAEHFQASPPTLVCVSLHEVAAVTGKLRPRKFSLFKEDPDPRIGYNRKGYIDGGWQFSLSDFKVKDTGFSRCRWSGKDISFKVASTKGGEAFARTVFQLLHT